MGDNLKTWKQFPTRHPTVMNSNVRLMSVTFNDGKTYAIPTMVMGKQLSNEDALKIVKEKGLDNYPRFDTVEEAESWIAENHGNINEEGMFQRPKLKVKLKK